MGIRLPDRNRRAIESTLKYSTFLATLYDADDWMKTQLPRELHGKCFWREGNIENQAWDSGDYAGYRTDRKTGSPLNLHTPCICLDGGKIGFTGKVQVSSLERFLIDGDNLLYGPHAFHYADYQGGNRWAYPIYRERSAIRMQPKLLAIMCTLEAKQVSSVDYKMGDDARSAGNARTPMAMKKALNSIRRKAGWVEE